MTATPRIELSALELDPRSGLARTPPRPEDMRQPSYEQEFDYHTVLYDVFWSADGREIVGVGPPLANLADKLLPLLRQAFCWPVLSRFEYRELDRCGEIWIRRPRGRTVLPAGAFRQSALTIQPNLHHLFQSKKVALTKSRNSSLSWLRDWAYFQAKAHGGNGVLLYDNASTNLALDEIQHAIAAVPGIETAVVVAWPYKFGPQAAPVGLWDSDYCQYGILEHARHRFLATAGGVLQGDPDEFVITENGVSAFDLAARSSTGYIRYAGHWIGNATVETPEPSSRRHLHYRYYGEENGIPVKPKWTVVPGRCPRTAQWEVHDVIGMTVDNEVSRLASIRHFKAINTNWKMQRWCPEAVDPARHAVDEELVCWLEMFDEGSD